MLGELNKDQIEAVLSKQIVGRVGCHADDITYVVPTSYAYDGQNIYVRTFEGMKMKMMRKNPSVCFEVDILENMGNWQSVIAWGEFEEIIDPNERVKALQILNNRVLPELSSVTTHLVPEWPFSPDDLSRIKGSVFRIVLKEKHGRFESNEASPWVAG